MLAAVLLALMAAAPLPDPLAAGWQGKKVCEKLHEDEHQRIRKRRGTGKEEKECGEHDILPLKNVTSARMSPGHPARW